MESIAELARNYKVPAGAVKTPAQRSAYTAPDLATLHQLDTDVHPSVKLAVDAARKWQLRRQEQKRQYEAGETNQRPNASLILVASQMYKDANKTEPDMDRTGYGCGKTHIARAICWSERTVTMEGVPVAPMGTLFLGHDILGLLGSSGEGDLEMRAILGTSPIMAIDDIGAEGEIPFIKADRQEQERQARYFRIINYCYEKGVSVVITANLTIPQLAAHVGGRCWSRLMEMAPQGFIIDMTGCPDWRRRTSGR